MFRRFTICHYLSGKALQRITNIITNKHRVIVGDAGGADTVIQRHLLAADYRDVEVFCSGPHSRNNLGNWRTHHIRPPRAAAGFNSTPRKIAPWRRRPISGS